MAKRVYQDLIGLGFEQGKLLVVGLDPDLTKIPSHLKMGDTTDPDVAVDYCKKIVKATHGRTLGYKPNAAFFARLGARGVEGLRHLVGFINDLAPQALVILDSKRGDIGNSMVGYVAEAFDYIGADAMTASPYLGRSACQPLLDRKDKGAIFLCKTTNPDSGEFQDVKIMLDDPEEQAFHEDAGHMSYPGGGQQGAVELYRHVAYRVSHHWNQHGNCALVVGATHPRELGAVRRIASDLPLLIPGIGTQGGDEEATIAAGRDRRKRGMMINVGGAILFASSGHDCFDAARAKAEYYDERFLNLANA